MESKSKQKTPDISIDDALNLFLAVTYPNGIPEGVDKEQLMEALRQKISKDRPQWAKADEERTPPSSSSPPGQSYSQVKEEIICKAQQEEVPRDPEERYLYERRKEARQNREQKKAEEKEDKIQEDMRKRLIAQKKGTHDQTLERALQIRQVLEQRVHQVLQIQPHSTNEKPSNININMQPANIAVTGLTPLKNQPTPAIPVDNLAPALESKTGKQGAREFLNSIKDLDPDEKVRSFQEFNRVRRSKLKSREELLSSRRPSGACKRAEALSIDLDNVDREGKKENKKGEPLTNDMAFSSNSRSSRLTLE
jgi:hypothetical protein